VFEQCGCEEGLGLESTEQLLGVCELGFWVGVVVERGQAGAEACLLCFQERCELAWLERFVGERSCSLEIPPRLAGGPEGPRSFTGTDQCHARTLLDSLRILRIGGEFVRLDEVRRDHFCHFFVCQRCGQMFGGGEVASFALALGERLVGDVTDGVLQEPVLTLLRRAWVGLMVRGWRPGKRQDPVVKLGVSIEIQEGMSYGETLALARAAERAGFDAALLAEHYCASSGSTDPLAPEAWVYLAALARDTEWIRLGTLVSPVTFRHPSVLAKLAATLDHVSDGRAELGLGAGWLESEHASYGFDFPPPAERVDLLEEQLKVITGMWTRDPFTHEGQHYHLRDCSFTPRPVQQPHPPLIVGGRPTSRRLPRLAGRYAQEYCVAVPTPAECTQVAELLGQTCGLSAFT
jgi:luciferase-like monooxygenase